MNIDFLPNCAGMGGGESKLNIYCQMEEPVKKDGIWVHTDIPYKSVIFDNMSSIASGWKVISATIPRTFNKAAFQHTNTTGVRAGDIVLNSGYANSYSTEYYVFSPTTESIKKNTATTDMRYTNFYFSGNGSKGWRTYSLYFSNIMPLKASGFAMDAPIIYQPTTRPFMNTCITADIINNVEEGKDKIYLWGGLYATNNSDEILGLQEFDLSTEKFTCLYQSEYQRSHKNATTGSTNVYNPNTGSLCVGMGDYVYIFLGAGNRDIPDGHWMIINIKTQTVEEYGAISGENAEGTNGGQIREIIANTTYGTIVKDGDCFYYCGGLYNGIASAAIYKYDTKTKKWSSEEPMPISTKDGSVYVDSDGVWYLFGGINTTGEQNKIAIREQNIPQYSPYSVIVFRYDNNAKNIYGTELITHPGITSQNNTKNSTQFFQIKFTDGEGHVDKNVAISVGNGTQYTTI